MVDILSKLEEGVPIGIKHFILHDFLFLDEVHVSIESMLQKEIFHPSQGVVDDQINEEVIGKTQELSWKEQEVKTDSGIKMLDFLDSMRIVPVIN